MLNNLGDRELHREEGCIVTTHSASGQVTALLYHYPPEVLAAAPISRGSRTVAEQTLATGSKREANLRISGLKPGASFVIETLDADHGFALRGWQAMGSPEPPTREQIALLRAQAMATATELVHADTSGHLILHRTLDAWSLVLVRQL
jgi:xylan 1,4-beta-xylosidase